MFKKLLIGYDGSEGSKIALNKGIYLAEFLKAKIIVLAVGRIPDYAETVSEIEEAKEQAWKYYHKILEEVKELSRDKNLEVTTMIKYGKPAEVIVEVAEENEVDLIILGPSRYSYMRRRILGSTAEKVVERAGCSVLIVK